jgi:dTDP-4-amino-4,6-dideoxygalactose transaminase
VKPLALLGGEPIRQKPFPGWPAWGQEEIAALVEVVRSGKWGMLHGTQVKSFETRFARMHQASFGICVNSGTTALRIALQAAGVGPGDHVIVPAYTFVATATAVLEAGAVPIFADIDLDTFNIDAGDAEQRATPRTRAIMPVHFAGRPVDWDAVEAVARRHDWLVIEDAAQAWGAVWKERPVGALGTAAGFSFQSSKNITAGEGGILLTNDETVAKFARSHANCGRTPEGAWYEHHYLGGNFRMTEFQAAVLHVQLDRYEPMRQRREANARFLDRGLLELPGVAPLARDDRISRHAEHLYIFRYDAEAFGGVPKGRFVEALRAEGIPCSPGYTLPLYRQPLFLKRAFGPRGAEVDVGIDYREVSLPNCETACAEQAVWLTQSVLLGEEEDMRDILRAVEKIWGNREALAQAV